jgi:hypothetical protein
MIFNVRSTARPESFDSSLSLSSSKGERPAQDRLADQPPRFALRRSAAASAKADGRAASGSWFDTLTTSEAGTRRARHRKAALATFIALLMVAPLSTGGLSGARSDDGSIAALERSVTAAPEDLRLCAEYRQRIIAVADYDRAITLLERLSERRGAGPHVYMSLALAYVDKVPAASPFKRIFLGRDAMRALSRSIEREPSLVAYYIRGLINLYYPEAVFHRARGGIADLERGRGMLATLPPQPYHARVYVSLGDGYWKVKDLARAVSIWTDGANRFPADQALRSRVAARGADLDRLVEHALDPATRVDTTLHELFPSTPLP